jgi:hypothetical protein
MATYTLAAGDIGAHNKTLAAGVVDTVTFPADFHRITIISDGAAAIFYTTDGSTPTVAGANCYILPAGAVSADTRTPQDVGAGAGTTVKLISAGTPTYSVQRES